METHITANDLKTRGVTALKEATRDGHEAIISVRGRDAYVVIPIELYNRYREQELELAVREARADYKKGAFKKESPAQHIKRITRG